MDGSKVLLLIIVIVICNNVIGQSAQTPPANSMTPAQHARMMNIIRSRNTQGHQTAMNPLMMYLMMQSGQPLWMMMLLMNPNADFNSILPLIILSQSS